MIKKFKDPEEASRAMAEDFKSIANNTVEKNGRFTVALTGGSSPLLLHTILHTEPYKSTVPWNQTFIFWGDERVVPFNDEKNNAKMAFDTLLDFVPIPKEQIFRMNSEIDPKDAAQAYTSKLKEHFGKAGPTFDLVFLGMGADGHIASIFPGSENVHEQKKWVSTGYNAAQGTHRITLTAPLINKAKNVFFAVFGTGKSNTLRRILKGEYNPDVLPAQLIKPESGNLTWYLDEEAGEYLEKD